MYILGKWVEGSGDLEFDRVCVMDQQVSEGPFL